MMGRQVERAALFYEFSLERHVPGEHLLRRLDAALDLSWLRAELAPFYSLTGRPSIDPELMIRMLLVGYCYGVRSERRLCDEVHLNLGYRWFCRLGLDGDVPDHSTFSKARHGRFREAEVFRRVFERVVGTCMTAGLVGGEGFAIDASVIEADASYALRVDGPTLPPEQSDPASATRPVREYLAALDQAAARVAGGADGEGPERSAAEPAPAKSLSLTDPAAAWTHHGAEVEPILIDQPKLGEMARQFWPGDVDLALVVGLQRPHKPFEIAVHQRRVGPDRGQGARDASRMSNRADAGRKLGS